MTGFDEEAMRVATAAVELAPQFPEGYHMRGLAQMYAGRNREAVEDLVRVPVLGNPSAWPLAKRCIALVALGQLEEVQQILGQVLARSATEFMTHDAIACIYTHLGDHDEAFRWLERAATEQAFWLSYLGIEPMFAPLRRDARFEPFCRKWRIPVQPLPATAIDAWTPPAAMRPSPKGRDAVN
jgi:tetratricopeptide (TPR) repeat protein